MDNEMTPPYIEPGNANPGDMGTDAAPSGKSIRKGLAIGLTAGVLGGAVAGFAFGVPGLSSAASPSVVQQTEDSVPSSDPVTTETTPSTDPAAPAPDEEAGTRLRDALQPLVDDGTITAAQADAVVAQLKDSFPGRAGHGGGPMGGDHRGGHGGGEFGRFFGEASDALTELFGIDAATLRDELSSGSTLAEVATAHGVDTQAVIDTLVTAATAEIDQAVTDGRIDADKADEIKAALEERVTDRVNGVRPERPAHDATDDDAPDAPVTTED